MSSPSLHPTLNFDPTAIATFLADASTQPTPFGDRPTARKGDLIVGLAPAYYELGLYLAALANRHRLPSPRFGNPFPRPLIKPVPELVGRTLQNAATPFAQALCLATAQILPSVPDGPCLLVEIIRPGLIVDLIDRTSTGRPAAA